MLKRHVDTIEHVNIYKKRVSEKKKSRKREEGIFEKIMALNSTNLMKSVNFHILGAQ